MSRLSSRGTQAIGPAEIGRRLYGKTFGVPKSAIVDAMTDWSTLARQDQLYVIANLLYLNLQEASRVERGVGDLAARIEELLLSEGPVDEDEEEPEERTMQGRPTLHLAPRPGEIQLSEEGEDDDESDEESEIEALFENVPEEATPSEADDFEPDGETDEVEG